jgi:hypothetical protein
MAKSLYVEVIVCVPEDPFTAAGIYQQLQPSWASLLDALKNCGAQYDFKIKEMETRTKAKRAPRKPKLVMTPPEAA